MASNQLMYCLADTVREGTEMVLKKEEKVRGGGGGWVEHEREERGRSRERT